MLVTMAFASTDDLKWLYERAQYTNLHLTKTDRSNNPFLENNTTLDSLYKSKRTRYYPITGIVTIDSKPRAWLTIDSVKYGLTPVTIDDLPVGVHQLELTGGDYETISQEINVYEDNKASYSFQLKRLCVATITTDKPGDKVFVDSVFVGTSPVTIKKPFGVYSIGVKRSLWYSREEELSYTMLLAMMP